MPSPEAKDDYWSRFWQFCASGLFFMVVGSLFLLTAYFTMGPAHSSFSFILVVVGVAILLFGTGTQGIGELNTGAEAARYKISIAGGAGVLAFCVGYGMLEYSSKIKDAFQIEKRYLLLIVEPNNDGNTSFANFVAQFSIDGVHVPAMRRGDALILYIPYLGTENLAKRMVKYEFYQLELLGRVPALKSRDADSFEIEINERKLVRSTASFDFPVYWERKKIDLRVRVSNNVPRRSEEPAGAPAPKLPSEEGS